MSERASKVSKKTARATAESGGKTTKVKVPGRTARMKRPPGRGTKAKLGRVSKAGRAPRKDEQELEPITAFNRGLSIGVKFAGFTACVVGLFMGLLGYLTYSITARQMDAQINEQGVSIVSALEKAIDRGFWVGREQPLPQDVSEQEAHEAELLRRLQERHREELVGDWRERLKGIVESSGEKIVAISIIEKDRSDARKQSRVAQFPVHELAVAQSPLATEGKIEIFDGRISTGDRVRRFDKQISLGDLVHDQAIDKALETLLMSDPDGKEFAEARAQLVELTRVEFSTADEWREWREQQPRSFLLSDVQGDPWVSIFVKASRLDEVKAQLWKQISIVTLCGAVAGILLTVLIATVLTGPIRELEQDIAQVAGGDLGHQTGVRSTDEIGSLAHVFNIMTRNLAIAQNNAVERKAFERELNIAKEIQEKLLPERIPQIPGFDIHSHYNAAKEVGGDYYDFIVIDQTHLGIIVADVAGKGIPGAMVMTMARSLVRLASVRNVSPADTFKKVNRILAKDIRRGMFVTAAYMVLNVKSRTLRVASAGHNPVVLFRAKTGENELIKPAGIALGFDKGTIFDNHIQEVEVQLDPGDRIVTYTDGVNEAMNNDSEEFGDDRFYDLVKQHASKSSKDFVEAVVGALEEHRANAEQSDDITITTLSVQGDGGAPA